MRFISTGLDAMIRDMERLGEESGEMAEAMVNVAADEIRAAWKESAEKHGLRDTGDMIDSIDFKGPVFSIGDALARDVYPLGKDKKGVRNAEKAFILHYGKNNFDATYWVDDADDMASERINTRLPEMWGEFLETGKVPAVAASASGSGSGISKHTK